MTLVTAQSSGRATVVRLNGAAVMVAGFCSMLNLYAPQAILPLLSSQFGVPPATASLTIAATALAVALTAPLSGLISDRVGRKLVVVAALLGVTIPTLASALVPDLTWLLVTRFLQGVFIPGIFVATLAYVNEETPPGARGRMTACYVTANVVGGFTGRLIGGLAADFGHWQSLFIALAVIDLIGALLIWRLMTPGHTALVQDTGVGSLRALLHHLSDQRLQAAFAVGFGILFSLVGVFTYIAFYLGGEPFALRPALVGAVFATYLVGALATPMAGQWIDRLGHRQAMLAVVAVALPGLALTLVPYLISVLPGLILFCAALFVGQATGTSFVAQAATSHRSAAVGLYLSFYYAGGAAGAVLPGLAYSAGGWIACVVLVGGALILVAAICSQNWRPKQHASAPNAAAID